MPEYPTFAWQETIVNAVAHRDYNDQGREIEVWFFDDRLEVLSPGELVVPVTLEHLRAQRRVHASRNPLLVRVLVEAGIMREEGEGIPRMFAEMEESSLKPPAFMVEDVEFRVTLWNEPVVLSLPAEPAWRVERASRLRGTFHNAANADQLALSGIVWCHALHRRARVTAIGKRRAVASRWRTTWRILYSWPRFQ